MATTHTNRLQAGAIQPVAKPEPTQRPTGNALAPIEPSTLDDVMVFAQIAMANKIGLANREEAAFRILYGRSLGMSAMQSIMGIDVIQNRPALKAGTVASMIQASGLYEYRVAAWDHLKCEIKFFDRGEHVGDSVFTIDDAKRAGVYKEGSNWSKYPKAMLFARAITQGARAYCPSIFFGPIYSSEELADGGGDVIDVEIAQPQAVAAEPVVEAKQAKPTKKPAKPVEPVIEAEPVADAPFDEEPQVETVADKVRKLDEWAERAAKRFEDKGQASFATAGAVVEEMYRRFADMGFVAQGATSYRARTQAIASIEASWAEILDSLKTFSVQLAAELEAPPADEPGSDG